MKTKNITQLTQEAKKQMKVVAQHSEKLGTILMALSEATVEEPVKQETKAKRGPGRPPKNKQVEKAKETKAKRGPGRPKKIKEDEEVKVTKEKTKRGPGRPPKDKENNTQNETLDFVQKSELKRIKNNMSQFNSWWSESTKDREIHKVENGTYLGVIEGFYSSGDSGRYGITTRIYVNPNSNLVPEELKGHINTAAVNRIRYVESKEEGLDYIEKQKAKLDLQFFNEILPNIISDHGKKGSVYAFHLDKEVRKKFKDLQSVFKTNMPKKELEKIAK